MNNKDKIIKYLSGLMLPNEAQNFEQEIRDSTQLNSLFEKYKKNILELKELSNIEIDESYFSNLIPRMRYKYVPVNRKSFILRIAPALPAIILSIFIAVNVLYINFGTQNGFPSILSEAIEESDSISVNQLLTDYPISFSTYKVYPTNSELIDQYLIESDIDITQFTEKVVVPVIDNYNLYELLNEEEVDYIYNALIDKKIL